MKEPKPWVYMAISWTAVACMFVAYNSPVKPPDLHPAGRVISSSVLTAHDQRSGMTVGIAYGANGAAGPVVVPTTDTVLTENTLVRTDMWELLVRGAWLVPVGTAIEADKNHKGSPIACISSKEKIVVSKKCVRILEYAQVRPPAVG
ncbi:hypothetical protein RMR16_026850 (plasmid) [Agrobacterium sp. rho-13.3]|uniref:hypothetical protein n=1 Tax=Agrobacterium sp. rho-13.3 TaxID=3072980 RepID=UPI002A12CE28|nr:hypothetical protein [Agrobacterium sp. rho-13.3]MDX8311575.1 hypothetical protein [Agrobacterium sp. rho-13.3]